MLRCANGPLDDYINVQREQTLPTSSSTSAQVTVHDPYTIPCTTTSSVPVHFQPPHHPPQPPHPREQNILSNAITALTSNRKRRKRGSKPTHPATQAGQIEEGQESEVEEALGSESWRCPYYQCPAASLAAPGWISKQSLMVHINNVHLAAGQSPPEELLRLHHRTIRNQCKVLVSNRGCPICKGRVSQGLLNSHSAAIVQSEQYHSVRNPFPLSCEWAFSIQSGTVRHIPRAVRTEFAESLAECI